MFDRRVGIFLASSSPRIRRSLLAILVAGVPAAFLRITSDPFNVPKLTLLMMGVSIVAALRGAEVLHGARINVAQLAIPALSMAVPLVLSWVASPYRTWAVMGMHPRLQGILPYLFVLAFGVLLADAFAGRGHELAIALGWGAAIVGGYAVIQAIGLDPFEWALVGAAEYATSTTGNSNFTGGFLAISIPALLAVVLADPQRRRLAAKLLTVVVAGWLLARSQGAWAAGLAGAALVTGFAARDRYRWAPLLSAAAAILIAVVVVGVVVAASHLWESTSVPTTILVRARWWASALSMGIAHPLVGRGPNSFAIEGVHHRLPEDAVEFGFDFPDDPHSVPLAFLANVGVTGLIGFLVIVGWVARRAFVRRASLMTIGFCGAAIAYIVQALVSIDEITLRTGLWIALAGIAASSGAAVVIERKKPRSAARTSTSTLRPPARIAMALLAIAVLGVSWFAVRILLADVQMRETIVSLARDDVDAARVQYRSALALHDFVEYRGRYGLELMERGLADAGAVGARREVVDSDLAVEAQREFGFTDQVPYVFSIVSDARIVQAFDPGSEEAVGTYRRAFEIDPKNPAIRIELALALNDSGDYETALELLEDVRNPKNVAQHFGAYWGALALSAALVGDDNLARHALEQARSAGLLDENAQAAERLVR